MNKKLKLKIILTNIRRVIMSVLFVNLAFMNKVFAESTFAEVLRKQGPTCYATGPQIEPAYTIRHVFIGLVPIVLVIGLVMWGIIYIVKKHKNKSKKEENNDKQD